MGLRAFLIILAIFGMAKGVSSRCCPSCSTKSITNLSLAQRNQVMAKRDFLSNLTKNPDLLYNEANQQSVVTLTYEQERQILRNYPDIFTGREEFAEASRTVGTISVPLRQADCDVGIDGNNTCPEGCIAGEDGFCRAPTDCALGADGGTCRFRRATTHNRVCKPQLGTKPIILARETNGNIMQLVQLDGQNKNQWIFEETCKMGSLPPAGMTCGLAERIVRALFINLAGIDGTGGLPSDFYLAEVIIQCCVAVYTQ